MKKIILTVLLVLIPAVAFADGPYKVKPTGDGAFIVTMNDGKTQAGGVFTTEGAAKRHAKKLNKDEAKRADGDGDGDGK